MCTVHGQNHSEKILTNKKNENKCKVFILIENQSTYLRMNADQNLYDKHLSKVILLKKL